MALINGKQPAWSSIKFNFLGRDVVGISAINYEEAKDKANIYGAGDSPIARGDGNLTFKASISLKQFEVVAMQEAIAGKSITAIPPFPITVCYTNSIGAPMITDVLEDCEFLQNIRDWKQGDTDADIKLDLIISGIKWHG